MLLITLLLFTLLFRLLFVLLFMLLFMLLFRLVSWLLLLLVTYSYPYLSMLLYVPLYGFDCSQLVIVDIPAIHMLDIFGYVHLIWVTVVHLHTNICIAVVVPGGSVLLDCSYRCWGSVGLWHWLMGHCPCWLVLPTRTSAAWQVYFS
jgi:hypothetical protein